MKTERYFKNLYDDLRFAGLCLAAQAVMLRLITQIAIHYDGYIRDYAGDMTLDRLARALGIEVRALSGHMDALCELGLIERRNGCWAVPELVKQADISAKRRAAGRQGADKTNVVHLAWARTERDRRPGKGEQMSLKFLPQQNKNRRNLRVCGNENPPLYTPLKGIKEKRMNVFYDFGPTPGGRAQAAAQNREQRDVRLHWAYSGQIVALRVCEVRLLMMRFGFTGKHLRHICASHDRFMRQKIAPEKHGEWRRMFIAYCRQKAARLRPVKRDCLQRAA